MTDLQTSPKPATEKAGGVFSLSYSITCPIAASRERIWSILTNAEDFARWNSTVTSLRGTIALGQTLELKVVLAPKRTFKPKVTKLEANVSMEWSEGAAAMFRGVRTFTLSARKDGGTDFTMSEVYGGMMLPMIKGSLPDFGPAFETFAADLKSEAERSV